MKGEVLMGVVIGNSGNFYEIPEEVLAKYIMPEEKVKPIKEMFKRTKVIVEEPEVEGYGNSNFYGFTNFWQMFGLIASGPLGSESCDIMPTGPPP
jgi:hypothetical protein